MITEWAKKWYFVKWEKDVNFLWSPREVWSDITLKSNGFFSAHLMRKSQFWEKVTKVQNIVGICDTVMSLSWHISNWFQGETTIDISFCTATSLRYLHWVYILINSQSGTVTLSEYNPPLYSSKPPKSIKQKHFSTEKSVDLI